MQKVAELNLMCSLLMCCCCTHPEFLCSRRQGLKNRVWARGSLLCTATSQPLCPPFPVAAATRLFSRHPPPPSSDASSDPGGVLQYGWIWRKCYIESSSLHCLFPKAEHHLSASQCALRIMDWRLLNPPLRVISPVYRHARLLFQSVFESKARGLW